MTLTKVSVFINDNGEVTFFDNPKRKVNLRGTIFTIPKPVCGRISKLIVTRADETLMGG